MMSVGMDRRTVQSFDAATGAELWANRSFRADFRLRGVAEGVFVEGSGFPPVLLDGATGADRGSWKVVGDARFAGPTPLRVGPAEAAFDDQSLFATDEYGRLVAYRRDTGKPEWSYGVLAVGLAPTLEPTFSTPRVEWVGQTEVLVGLGVAADGAPVLSLFRRRERSLAPKRVHVHGLIDDPNMNAGYDIKLGPSSFNILPRKGGGEFEGDIEGRGSLRVSFFGGITPMSEVAPASAELSFESGPSVELRFLTVWETPRAMPTPGIRGAR
jgi:hypothetical protein